VVLTGSVASGQEPEDIYHWAYSAAFGTGTYRIGDDRVFVIRVSPQYELGKIADEQITVNFRLPITAGIQDLDLDIEGIADSISTLSFVPGLQLEYPVTDRWMLKMFGHYGWGWDLSGDEKANIHFGGVNSRYALRTDETLGVDLLNSLQWYGYRTSNDQSDRFARMITGLEANWPLEGWTIYDRQIYFKPHILHFWYFDNIGFRQIFDQPVELKEEVEIGLALGIKERMSVLIFKVDRIGIGYRIGNESRGIRFYLSSVFY
jgi:hypothetical protein